MNERDKRKLFTVSKYKKDNENDEYYDTLLKKLKKENEETNVSTTIKTKLIKQKFSNIKKFELKNNNTNCYKSIVNKGPDNEKKILEEKRESDQIILYLVKPEKKNKKREKEKEKEIENLNKTDCINTIKTMKHANDNLLKNIKHVDEKNVTNRFIKCLLCCSPMN